MLARNFPNSHYFYFCPITHDCAANQLSAGRPKDPQFVRRLLLSAKLDPTSLIDRLHTMPLESEVTSRLVQWVRATSQAIPG